MSDTAAHLVDRVLPEAPIRQWVLSLPYPLRFRLAYDRELLTAVLTVFIRTLFRSLRRRARATWGIRRTIPGAVTFIQRFGSAANLNIHLHSLLLDGVYTREDNEIRLLRLPPPDDQEVARLVATIARRTQHLLESRGLLDMAHSDDPDEQPLLGAIYGASITQSIATGARAGRPVMRLGDRIEVDEIGQLSGPRCASLNGFSLHADVAVVARDRKRLERLCRYVARPPIATERLTELPDGRIAYALKRPWRDGTTHFAFTKHEFIEKLVALVPAPRANLVRYHGCFAPGSKIRAQVVRDRESERESLPQTEAASPSGSAARSQVDRPRRLAWADLMKRVFEKDVLECPHCSGRLKLIATITDPRVIAAILTCLRLPIRAPPLAPARPGPALQSDFWPDP
jgi:hypothetical protein